MFFFYFSRILENFLFFNIFLSHLISISKKHKQKTNKTNKQKRNKTKQKPKQTVTCNGIHDSWVWFSNFSWIFFLPISKPFSSEDIEQHNPSIPDFILPFWISRVQRVIKNWTKNKKRAMLSLPQSITTKEFGREKNWIAFAQMNRNILALNLCFFPDWFAVLSPNPARFPSLSGTVCRK